MKATDRVKLEKLIDSKMRIWKAIDAMIEMIDDYGRDDFRPTLVALRRMESVLIDRMTELENKGVR